MKSIILASILALGTTAFAQEEGAPAAAPAAKIEKKEKVSKKKIVKEEKKVEKHGE